jgi:hypothetical protein
VVGKEYVVYGMTTFLEHVWFYICDEDYSYYPIWNPLPLFKVVDARLSKYWLFGVYTDHGLEAPMPIIAFKEWVENPFFYDQLTDKEEPAVETFARYKTLLDEEFDDTSIAAK